MVAQTKQPKKQPLTWFEEELQTTYLRLKGAVQAERLWTRILTADDRARLGGDLETAYHEHGGAAGMWRKLRGVSLPQAVLGAGVALHVVDPAAAQAVLRALGEDPEGDLDRAIASGGLILAEDPRRMWWKREMVEIDWFKWNQPWVILDIVARESKAGRALDRTRIDSATTDVGYLKKAISRLTRLLGFPVDLASQIRTVGNSTYQLDLAPESIRIFERGPGDELVEWRP